jgi:hypothetical protein
MVEMIKIFSLPLDDGSSDTGSGRVRASVQADRITEAERIL